MPVTSETTPREDLPTWSEPQVACYETRPEVTAYAGEGVPWIAR
jgi:hypothetical protein